MTQQPRGLAAGKALFHRATPTPPPEGDQEPGADQETAPTGLAAGKALFEKRTTTKQGDHQ